jgi:hypothetical protein
VNQKIDFEKNLPIRWVGAEPSPIRYDAEAMAKIDGEKEYQRLADLYAGMEQGELEQIAAQAESLTDVAKQAIRAEMSRRGMPPPLEAHPEASISKEPKPPVMIRRYQSLPEALLSKSILDSAGIESFLADENLVRIDWFYSNLVGGIKLLVRDDDADASSKLLAQEIPEEFNVAGVGDYQQPRCPRCQSFDVTFDELNKKVAYMGFLFLKPPISITSSKWKCHACGNEWEDGVGARDSKPQRPGEPH